MFKALVGALVVLAALAVFGAPALRSAAERSAQLVMGSSNVDRAAAQCVREGGYWLSIPASVAGGECSR